MTMNCTTRLKIGDINKNVICVLCGGYYVDATTIIECLHSFCRTCIVTYLKTSKTCPVCDTIVHKTRPHQNIRSDKLLQDLVYKLVPGLYKDEMRRRREFYTTHYDAAPKRPGEERGDEMVDRFAYTEEEKISLALYFCPDGAAEQVDFRRVFATKEDVKARMEKRIKEAVDVRYLQCKAAVTVGHLKKFVKLKYGLPAHFQVDMYYNDEPLRNSCTLCDVAYFFNWRRRSPLMLTFTVSESPRKQLWAKEFPLLTYVTSVREKPAPDPPLTSTSTQACTDTPTEAGASTIHYSVSPPVSVSTSEKPESQVEAIPKPVKPEPQLKSSHKNKASKTQPFQTLPPKPGPCKQPQKTKTSCGSKRPATTPIPIAPAPAKIPALASSRFDVSELVQMASNNHKSASSSSAKFVSLLPVGMIPTASKSVHTNDVKPPTAPTFSDKNLIPSSTLCTRPTVSDFKTATKTTSEFIPKIPLLPQHLTSATSLPVLSVYNSISSKSKLAAQSRTHELPQNRSSRHIETASSSSLSSSTPSSSSSTPLASVNITQSPPTNSVASPTPASSASPTPAAVPIQQSQTQGSDSHASQSPPTSEQAEMPRKASVKHPNSTATGHQTNHNHLSDFKPEVSEIVKSETSSLPTLTQTQNISRPTNTIQRSNNCTQKQVFTDSSSSPALKLESTPPSSTPSAHPLPDERDSSISPAVSPTSNRPNSSPSVPKPIKQKKIADIANTLHKRVSDALLNMVNKRSNSPSNRRPSLPQSAGAKSTYSANTSSDLRGAPTTPASHLDMPAKQSLQKMPQNGHFLGNGTSKDVTQHNQTDEPLNLVKGDKEFGRFTNGMFAVDIPPTLT